MNPEYDAPDLAAQAAAWVPPWQRPAVPRPDTPDPDHDTDDLDLTDFDEADADADDVDPGGVAPVVIAHQREPGGWVEMVGVPTPRPHDVPVAPAVPEWAAPEPDEVPAGASPSADAAGAPADLAAALEAILLVVDEPVGEAQLAEVLDVSAAEVTAHLTALAAGYTAEGRGFDLRRAAGGWRLYTRPEYAAYVERFVLDGQSVRLTQAALETLAVIAYQQPVTRSRISAVRGVNCDGVVRTLTARGLIEECGTQPESGAFLYRTTALFLEKLGLDSVDELPPLAPFLPDDVEGFADVPR